MTPVTSQDRATVILLGDGPLAAAILARLDRAESSVHHIASLDEAAVRDALIGVASIQSLVIMAAPPTLGTALLDVDDHQLEGALEQFLDLFGALHVALPRLQDGGGVVVVSARGHLGGWGGAHEMAFCGAIAGLLRSVALENMDRGVRANVIAIELPGAHSPVDPSEVADLAHYLLSPDSGAVNGELILANAGRSLKMREARDRRAAKPLANAQPG